MALDKNPIATKAVTSAVLTLAGDLICQVPHLFFHLKLYSEFVAHALIYTILCGTEFITCTSKLVNHGFEACSACLHTPFQDAPSCAH